MPVIEDERHAIVRVDDRVQPPFDDLAPSQSQTEGKQEADSEGQFDHLPRLLIDRYVAAAVRRACTEQLGGGNWYAEIPILPGVWADGATEEDARAAIVTVVMDWLLFKIEDHDRDIPVIDTINLNFI